MRERVAKQVRTPAAAAVLLAFVAVVLYSLWGAALLNAQKQAANPPQSVAVSAQSAQ